MRQNMLWFKGYLSNSKQYIEYKDDFNEQKSTNLLQLFSQGVYKFCLKMQIISWKRLPNGLRTINFH